MLKLPVAIPCLTYFSNLKLTFAANCYHSCQKRFSLSLLSPKSCTQVWAILWISYAGKTDCSKSLQIKLKYQRINIDSDTLKYINNNVVSTQSKLLQCA